MNNFRALSIPETLVPETGELSCSPTSVSFATVPVEQGMGPWHNADIRHRLLCWLNMHRR
jgi:hypothetical protein